MKRENLVEYRKKLQNEKKHLNITDLSGNYKKLFFFRRSAFFSDKRKAFFFFLSTM